jgi:hypothetical protein
MDKTSEDIKDSLFNVTKELRERRLDLREIEVALLELNVEQEKEERKYNLFSNKQQDIRRNIEVLISLSKLINSSKVDSSALMSTIAKKLDKHVAELDVK